MSDDNRMCPDCRGKGDYPGLDITCRRCNGSGAWRPEREPAADDPCLICGHTDPVDERGRCTHATVGQADNMDVSVCGHQCWPDKPLDLKRPPQPARDPDHLRPEKGGNRAADDYW